MKRFFTSLFVILLLLSSCSTTEQSKNPKWPPACCNEEILPPGNVNKLDSVSYNTGENEIAPVQRLRPANEYYDPARPYQKEFLMPRKSPADGVLPSADFLNDSLNLKRFQNNEYIKALGYLTNNIESLTYTSENNGFVSFSHPPNKDYAAALGLPLKGMTGGTDIFEFELTEGGAFEFKNLAPLGKINSEFWDSHPFALDTLVRGRKITLLMWSSDRHNAYSKKIFKDGRIENKGETDIYYSFNKNNKWTEPKKLETGINSPASFEGTPFLYCLCQNPYLLFSSNRNDPSPLRLDEDKTEDFDIFYAQITIDIENEEIFLNSTVQSFKKNNENIFFALDEDTKKLKKDSSINTYSDDRFPFVPNPVDDPDNRYIYLSSNRNPEPVDYGNSDDTLVVSEGNYDIYRFPMKLQCKAKKRAVKLKLYVINAETGELVREPKANLINNNDVIQFKKGSNPLTFDSLNVNSQYKVKGGSKFFSAAGDNCGDIDTTFFAPENDTLTLDHKKTESFVKNETINSSEISKFTDRSLTEEKSVTNYINTLKFTGTSVIHKEITGKPEISDEDYSKVNVEMQITEEYDYDIRKIIRSKTGKKLNFVNNLKDVESANIPSEKTKNNGLYTYGLSNGSIIRDTLYLVKKLDTTKCITLNVKLIDSCNRFDPIKQPFIKIKQFNPESNSESILPDGQFNDDFATFRMKQNRYYAVYGGSDFINQNECPDTLAYLPADLIKGCNAKTSFNDFKKPLEAASEATKFKGTISTYDLPADTVINDVIYLKPVIFQKPPCEYEFTKYQDSLHRKVPYFQTGFWEVNTTENFRRDITKLENNNSIYGDPYVIKDGSKDDGKFWPGAKWIELHPNNYYWGKTHPPSRRNRRKNRYGPSDFASKVDSNLNQMVKVISNELIPSYELISKRSPEENNKLIIRVEAWSDFRPVKHGWYISKADSEDVITYAECEEITNYNAKQAAAFERVFINNGDPLGKDNEVLSKLRAYFGYHELIDRLKKTDSFSKYSDDEILLPGELMDGVNLKSSGEIKKILKQSKLIFIAKGYRTKLEDELSGTSQRMRQQKLSSLLDLDSVRAIQVIVKTQKFEQEKFMNINCCDDNPDEIDSKGYLKEEFFRRKKR